MRYADGKVCPIPPITALWKGVFERVEQASPPVPLSGDSLWTDFQSKQEQDKVSPLKRFILHMDGLDPSLPRPQA